ncbi:adenylate/guanylate cyclase domain-containing protein [Streptomyces ardesiacus]|uniref:adenylate/guanylate cyclase domain-containing protein n=1 Tax=Streptomyces ardesiacus TaxID=285564 RepID=UPI003686190F
MTVDHYTLFREALDAPERAQKTILFADLSGSTEMKEKTAELTWLPTIGKFLDITVTAITAHGGCVVKYLGDGTMAVFDGDLPANALCAAIGIQEALDEDRNLHDRFARVGIATGSVVEYEAPGGGLDYVGSVVDLAARLCGASSPQAIWADSNTVSAANMNKVSSKIGRALGYAARDYLSPRDEKVELKGFANPVVYREVIWHRGAFGVANELMTEKIDRSQAQHEQPLRANTPLSGPADTLDGVVTRWDPVLGRGFISTTAHGDHYVDRRYIANGEDLTQGQSVRFVPMQPTREGVRPIAGCTVQEGHVVHGTFHRVFPDRKFAFVDVLDTRGNRQSLHVFLGEDMAHSRPGERVSLKACRNRQGISGQLIGTQSAGETADDHNS